MTGIVNNCYQHSSDFLSAAIPSFSGDYSIIPAIILAILVNYPDNDENSTFSQSGNQLISQQFVIMFSRNQPTPQVHDLPPISQVYSTESIYVGNQLSYSGFIKRDSSILSVWHARNFYIDTTLGKNMRFVISKLKQTSVQQTLSLQKCKITKKCTEIDGYWCFGLITEKNSKYLISIKNVHECQKFHAEINYLKRSIKNFSLLGSFSNKQENYNGMKKKQFTGRVEKTKVDASEQVMNQEEEKERMKKVHQGRLRIKNAISTEDQQAIFSTNFVERPCSIYVSQAVENLYDFGEFFSFEQSAILDDELGFHHYSGPQQSIHVSALGQVRDSITIISRTGLQAHLQNFIALQLWNKNITKTKILSRYEDRMVMYIQFSKSIIAHQTRCAIVQVTTVNSECFFGLKMKSIKRADCESLSGKKQIGFELISKVIVQRSNRMQKVMTTVLTLRPAKEQFDLAVRFMKQMKQYRAVMEKQN